MTSETTSGLRCAVRCGLSLGASTPSLPSLASSYRLLPWLLYGLQPQACCLDHMFDMMA